MIQTKEDLREYMQADFLANEGRGGDYKKDLTFKMYMRRLLGWWSEFEHVRYYLRILRHYEYYFNNRNRNVFNKILCKYYFSRWRKLSMSMRVHIPINVVGKGFRISHYVGGVIVNCFSIGNFCSVASGVVVGNKDTQKNRATIGNHVKLTLGVKIIGKVVIGDNVIVAPNSVVVKDVEPNSVVSGIPAKMIKKIEVD